MFAFFSHPRSHWKEVLQHDYFFNIAISLLIEHYLFFLKSITKNFHNFLPAYTEFGQLYSLWLLNPYSFAVEPYSYNLPNALCFLVLFFKITEYD